LPSIAANWLIARATGVRIHDTGCTLKVYRDWVVKRLFLYSDLHRFIPALAAGAGARVGEIPVQHHSRRFGISKYGIARVAKVFFDLMSVKMIVQFSAHPIRWFGMFSMPLFMASLGFFVFGIVQFRSDEGPGIAARWDALSISAALVTSIVGFNVFLLGFLSELLVNTSGVFAKRTARSLRHATSRDAMPEGAT
jgi:hypothetical protein